MLQFPQGHANSLSVSSWPEMDLIGTLVSVYSLNLVLLTVLNLVIDFKLNWIQFSTQCLPRHLKVLPHFVDVPLMLVLGLCPVSICLNLWSIIFIDCFILCTVKKPIPAIACSLFALHTWQFPSNLVICQNSLKRSATPTKRSMWMISKLYWTHVPSSHNRTWIRVMRCSFLCLWWLISFRIS